MLVTLESDHIISHQYVDVANRSATIDLKLPVIIPEFLYTATLINHMKCQIFRSRWQWFQKRDGGG